MSLTPDQDAYLRSRLGSGYDDSDAEERLVRLGGDGYEPMVVVEVLQQRLADLATKPAQFTIVGEYSENRAENIKLTQEQYVKAVEEAAEAGLGGAFVVLIQQAEPFDTPIRALDTEEFIARSGRLSGGR